MILTELLLAQQRENDVRSTEFYRAITGGIKRLHIQNHLQLADGVDDKLTKFLGGYGKVIAQADLSRN